MAKVDGSGRVPAIIDDVFVRHVGKISRAVFVRRNSDLGGSDCAGYGRPVPADGSVAYGVDAPPQYAGRCQEENQADEKSYNGVAANPVHFVF